MKRMKAQLWSMDLAASAIVFMLIFVMLAFAWYYVSEQSGQAADFSEMESRALSITDILVRSPGYPENWNESNVSSIGLADRENVLDPAKVTGFLNLDYNASRVLFGLRGEDYYFSVTYLNDSVVLYNGTSITKGRFPDSHSIIVPVSRSVLFAGTLAKLNFILYK